MSLNVSQRAFGVRDPEGFWALFLSPLAVITPMGQGYGEPDDTEIPGHCLGLTQKEAAGLQLNTFVFHPLHFLLVKRIVRCSHWLTAGHINRGYLFW